jgi:2-polyprenyl-6-methoxyphenol hydroxylase-like FAD-dependent oxidoreductase
MSDPRPQSPFTRSAKPVLISGAGLGGLLLAQSLRSHRIPFQLYERDTDGSSRSQGYRIRISVDGLSALEQVLDSSQYERFRAGQPVRIAAFDAVPHRTRFSMLASGRVMILVGS